MTLTVLSVAYPFAPVGLDAAGGAEQVLSLVESGLARRGHRSIVVASEGSRTAGELVATGAVPERIDERAREEAWRRHRAAIEAVLDRQRVDLVHMHGLDFHAYLPRTGVPVLATLHLPPSSYPPAALRPLRPQTWLQCVSDAQAQACPGWARLAGVVANGVPVQVLDGLRLARHGTAAIGRICPEKGLHLALEAARLADEECRLAGRVFPYEAHQRYFEEEVRPRLDSRRLFLGAVGLEAKRRLLSSVRCLLVPSLVAETSSLVAMEAFACGTPVIAFRRGALAEVVEHGRTGYLVADVREMAEAIALVSRIDPDACRQAARTRFSAGAMVDRYLALYRRILQPRAPATAAGQQRAAEA